MISYRATPELVLLDQWPRQVACDPQRVRERPADLAHRQTGDRHEIDAFAVFAQ